MRWLALIAGLALSVALAAQEEAPKKKKKPAAKQAGSTEMKAHQKPTREQIRKFNELEKKK